MYAKSISLGGYNSGTSSEISIFSCHAWQYMSIPEWENEKKTKEELKNVMKWRGEEKGNEGCRII